MIDIVLHGLSNQFFVICRVVSRDPVGGVSRSGGVSRTGPTLYIDTKVIAVRRKRIHVQSVREYLNMPTGLG